MQPNNASRRLFRRRKAQQAWWLIVAITVLTLAVGFSSNDGAARVEKVWPALAVLLGPLAGVMVTYFGASAWEAKSPNQPPAPGYGYGGGYEGIGK